MTDLTLNEFRGLSDGELRYALQIELQNTFGSIVLEKNHKRKGIDIAYLPFLFRCWFRNIKHIQLRWQWFIRKYLYDNR